MKFLIILLFVFSSGCGWVVSDDNAVQTLNNAGYSAVTVDSAHWIAPGLFGCSSDDAIAFDCEATNPVGHRVEATVCCGLWFKKCTIRN